MRPIGVSIALKSVGERWGLVVICVGGVVSFGGVQVPVLFMK